MLFVHPDSRVCFAPPTHRNSGSWDKHDFNLKSNSSTRSGKEGAALMDVWFVEKQKISVVCRTLICLSSVRADLIKAGRAFDVQTCAALTFAWLCWQSKLTKLQNFQHLLKKSQHCDCEDSCSKTKNLLWKFTKMSKVSQRLVCGGHVFFSPPFVWTISFLKDWDRFWESSKFSGSGSACNNILLSDQDFGN